MKTLLSYADFDFLMHFLLILHSEKVS
jgi:hypothetical protein